MRASFRRDTAETKVEVSIDLEGSGSSEVETGVRLLDEILRLLARGSGFDLRVRASGDLPTGDHHTVEDVAISFGQALAQVAVAGIGSSSVPAGEALAFAAVRFGATGYREEVDISRRSLEGMDLENLGHFMRTLAYNGGLTLHLRASGGDDWQKVEALATALGRALRRAVEDGCGDPGNK